MNINNSIAYQIFYKKTASADMYTQNKLSTENNDEEMSLSGHTPWSKQDYFDKITLNSAGQSQESYKSYININEIDPNLSQAERDNVKMKNMIKNALDETGLAGQDFEALEIGLNKSKKLTVSGLNSDNDNQKLADTLNDMLENRSPFIPTPGMSGKGNKTEESQSYDSVSYKTRMEVWAEKLFYKESDWVLSAENEYEKGTRTELIRMKSVASELAEKYTGIALDYSKLYRTDDGKIAGYPEELAWYFEQEIEKPTLPNPRDPSKEEGYALSMRYYADTFLNVGYENLPDADSLKATFKFSKSDLT
ncbi:MAG: hypothetical protein LBM93_16045 [Oscillospiraceae bacterium]|jgi:hypothetical protein|nr:hypothetical protein [Oscillospiraceae bacterium]